MKTIHIIIASLNLIIAFCIIQIMSDIEQNSTIKNPDYTESVIFLALMLVVGFFRIHQKEIQKILSK